MQQPTSELDDREVIQAMRCHVCKAGLLLREVALHDDILRLSSAQDVAITLSLAREFVPQRKRVTRRFQLVDAVTVSIQGKTKSRRCLLLATFRDLR